MPHAISEALLDFWKFRQENLTISEYYDRFQNHLKVLEHVGVNVADHPGLLKVEAFNPDEPTDAEITKAKDKFIATTFVLKANRSRYQKLIDDMENSNFHGNYIYPKNIVDAYHMLSNWKPTVKHICQECRKRMTEWSSIMWARKYGWNCFGECWFRWQRW